MAYGYKKRMSPTKRAYLAGIRKGKKIAYRKKKRFGKSKKRW